jgi:hypothetical protein
MEFKTKKSFRITRFLFALISSVAVGLVLFFNTSPRVLHTGILFVIFLLGMLGFDYFNSFAGKPSGKEQMKTDKSYRRKTYGYVLSLIIILFVFEILRYITMINRNI